MLLLKYSLKSIACEGAKHLNLHAQLLSFYIQFYL